MLQEVRSSNNNSNFMNGYKKKAQGCPRDIFGTVIFESIVINPCPGCGLSHLRHGGGQNDPPLTKTLGKLGGWAIRRSTALSEPVRSQFDHFFAQVNIEVSRGHQSSNFRKMMVLSGMPAIISGNIIATPNPKNQKIALETLFHRGDVRFHLRSTV